MKQSLYNHCHQEDLYPDTCSDVPAITAEEWWDGKNAEPVLVSVAELGNQVKKVKCHKQPT
jgi:hypothetical protein